MKHVFSLITGILLLLASGSAGLSQQKAAVDQYTFGAIEARHIGPARMSGRITCIDGLNSDDRVIYIGTAAGGIWKSVNAGTTVKPVFDKYTQSIGTLTIDQDRPDTVWAGTGETWVRNSVSVGDGIYRSVDGGDNWSHLGLEKTERIARILIHPGHPDTVFVAAMGQLWGPNPERGVYRTTDGGQSWEKILFIDENTGCADLAMDPGNPDILYAGMWDFRRKAYTFRSGGPGSGLYKSTDGGNSWTKITDGLPTTTLGRIALDVSPDYPGMVYALVEAADKKSALYRSLDYGKSWEKLNSTGTMGERPFYFSLIVADPVDTSRVYKPGLSFNFSTDGGRTFTGGGLMSSMGGAYHSDLHALWISPTDNNFMYMGTDGGVYVSHDQGSTWRILRNLPVSQFYHVSVDMDEPYHVYGGLQDNGSWFGPSAAPGGVTNADWENVGGGDGFYVFRDPDDPNIVYSQSQGGNINRTYMKTQESKTIKPYQEEGQDKLRFNWNTPVVFGMNSNAMYVGSQYLFRSTDKGDSWTCISPDLTTNDPEKQKQKESGGVTIDNTSAENHCTIITINESALDENIVWVGTDDGNLQVTRDGGKSWTNVTGNVPGLPPATWCSYVFPDRFDRATAYVCFDGHRNGDMKPYLFKTKDYEKTWTSLVDENIRLYCQVIKQDRVNPDLLFLGTEGGLFVSVDGGMGWSQFTGNLPGVPVYDLVIHPRENDLVLATHGRGIMIIDDITPLRHISTETLDEEVAFLPSRPYILRNAGSIQDFRGNDEFVGDNPPQAAMLTYYMKKRHIFGDMYIEVYDQEGEKISTLPAGKRKGINRVPLDIRLKPPRVPKGQGLSFAGLFGPTLSPGEYTVKIVKNDQVYEGKFSILDDPASPHSAEDRALQHKTLMKSYHMLEDLAYTDRKATDIMSGCQKLLEEDLSRSLKKRLQGLHDQVETIHARLTSTEGEGMFDEDVQLREKISEIYGGLVNYLGRPTQSQINNLEILNGELKTNQEELDNLISKDLATLNALLVKAGKKEITITGREAFFSEEK